MHLISQLTGFHYLLGTMKVSITAFCIFAAFLFPSSSYGGESNCDQLKKTINSKEHLNSELKSKFFENLNSLIQQNEKGAMYLSDKPVPTEGLPINKNTANLQYAMWDRACGSHGQYVKFSNK